MRFGKVCNSPPLAKIKGSKFLQYESAKIKGIRKMPRMNEKRQVRENQRGAKCEGARKLEARRLKARNLKGREF